MKSEPFRFSPTSAGVRIEHLNLHNNNNNNNGNNNCCNITDKSNDTFSLPRPRVPKSHQDEELEQIIVQNVPNSGDTGHRQRSNKMRNCFIIGGVTVLVCLLSFVLLIECRSLKGTTKSNHQDDRHFLQESRIQEHSVEPDSAAESSEEYPSKVVSTTVAPDQKLAKKIGVISSGGRLTRSRVSVICKGGYVGEDEGDKTDTTSSSSTGTAVQDRKLRKHDKELDLPTLLPRASDDDGEEDDNDNNSWSDETVVSSEESQQVITVTGYSHVSGGKPETKALKRSGSTTIKYVPKSSEPVSTNPSVQVDSKKISQDELEGSSSSEETLVITVKPKSKSSSRSSSSHQTSKSQGHKSSAVSHASHAVPASSSVSTAKPTESASRSSGHKKDKHKHHAKRDSSEEDTAEEEIDEIQPQSAKVPHKSSKRSGNSRTKNSDRQGKRDKGDSGEIGEEVDSSPTQIHPRRESRRSKKGGSDKGQKPTTEATPLIDPQLESAEAEPVAVVEEVKKSEGSSNRKSSRSRSTSENSKRGGDNKKSASSSKSVAVNNDSSEEYIMEEMPFTTPHENAKREKSRRSSTSSTASSSSSSSARKSRMSSKTAAPKLRTRTFASAEIGD